MDQSRFLNDLNELKISGYLKEKEYLSVLDSYHRYKEDLLEKATVNAEIVASPEPTPVKSVPPSKPKVELTSEQRRERNITSLMAVGVILLLLGGLTLATSNWEVFSSLTKTMLVGGIAVLFGGLGALSEKVIKIRKTAFTFVVLFALFIPITILSAGYFELFGNWLSFYGEGKYILGVLTSILCIPIYFWFSLYFQSKLFSWFTLISSVIGYAYLLLSVGMTKLPFYFLYALGNVFFIAVYHFRKSKITDVFLKTLPIFIQSNLILSTVLILIMFDSQLYQSFNIILTAVLYLAMRMVNERKEYEFLFIGFITYGLFQLIQSSILVEYSLLAVVLIPLVFLLTGKFSDRKLESSYHLANGAVSVLAFIYITVQGVLLSPNEGSVWLLLGYFVLTVNFIYLSYNTAFQFFKYLAPFYFISTLMEIFHLLGPAYRDYWALSIGLSSVVTYILGQLLKPLHRTSFIVGSGGILLSFLLTSLLEFYWQASILSFIITSIALRHYLQENSEFKKILAWIIPLFTFSTIFYIGMDLFTKQEIPLSILCGNVILIGIYLWKKAEPLLSTSLIAIAIVVSTVNFITTCLDSEDYVKVLTSLLLLIVSWYGTQHFKFCAGYAGIQICLFFTLYFLADWLGIPLFEVNSPYVYITIMYLLFISGELLKAIDRTSEHPCRLVTHCLLLLTVALSLLLSNQPLPIFLIAVLYGLYLYRSKKEYECMYSLYAGLSMLAICFHFFIKDWISNESQLFFSVLLVILYFLSKEIWQQRLIWYVVAFSLFFLGDYLLSAVIEPTFIILHLILTSVFIVFYHSLKGYWNYAATALFVYLIIDIEWLIAFYKIQTTVECMIWYSSGLLLTLTGMFYSKKLFTKTKPYDIDLFFIFGILHVLSGLIDSTGWITTIGLLILAVLFTFHEKRMPDVPIGIRVFQTLSSLLFLFTYYSFLNQFEIPAIIQTELYVLPWIALSYVITKRTWNFNEKISSTVQYLLLGIIAVILMIDAMQSYLIADAIILGTLSFISIIYGFISKQKSYFFTGLIVLLLNALIQTRPYWGNMPWWVYLLLTGILLIGFASFNEYKKQKGIETPPLKEVLLQKWRHYFGEWK